MITVGPTEVAYGALGGAVLGGVALLLFIVGLSAWDLHTRVKSGVPPHRHAWAVVSNLPKHVYHGTDWGTVAKLTPRIALASAVFVPLGIIFGVGVAEVFLR